jgi:hypothetical protein
MNKETILTIVKLINKSNKNNKEEYFAEEYKDFKEQFPHLFQYACNNKNINYNILEMMLDKLNTIKDNSITQEKASEEVGTVLFNEYISPVVSHMS